MQSFEVKPQPDMNDYPIWRDMWPDYYKGEPDDIPSDESLNKTWNLIFEKGSNVNGFFLYETQTTDLCGFLFYVLHDTIKGQQRCYLSDLYISPSYRRKGGARMLYDALLEEAQEEQCDRIYWRTKPENTAAQKLYDQIAKKTDWIRYEKELKS